MAPEKRKFITIEVPLLKTSIEALGTINSLTSKTIKLDLSRKLRGKGLNVTFQIMQLNDTLIAIPKKMELLTSYISKIIRKKLDYVEDSFKATTSDDIILDVKPLLITRKKVSRAVKNKLRITARENILEFVKANTYLDLTESLFNSELQKIILPKLKKVYPLAFCDLRVLDAKNISSIKIENLKLEDNKDEDEEDEGIQLNYDEDEDAEQ